MADGDLDAAVEHLYEHYARVNREKFGDVLPRDFTIVFNSLLRRLTGRITYGWKLIELSLWHFREYGLADAEKTLEHEMLHLYLHTLGKPSGHNTLFKEVALQLGIRVFHANPYPKNRASRHRYVYECPACGRMAFRKRAQQRHVIACGVCCRLQADGAWDERFALKLVEKVKFA
ncbi:MAG TPA: SprT-like domain-containing protein [Polyangia bacterium]|jgi:predicted SprT family Zn-dependent metalloprotease